MLNIFFTSLSASGYGSVIPDAPGADSHPLTKALGDKVGIYVEQYIEAMEKVTSPCIARVLTVQFIPRITSQVTMNNIPNGIKCR